MKNHTRREFLERAVWGAGAGVVFTVFGPGALAAPAIGATKRGRAYVAAKYAIEIDGVRAGWVHSVEGGSFTSDVEGQQNGPRRKQMGGVKYEDITLTCGTGMSQTFYEWIGSAFGGRPQPKDGAVSSCDFNFNEIARKEWSRGLITEVGLPALDASSRNAVWMTIKITPESVRSKKGGGRISPGKQPKQKEWLPSNFRLNITGLDCTRVNQVGALTLQQKGRGGGSVSNLVVTLPEADAATWQAWQRSEQSARAAAGGGKSGQLDYLSPNLREVLFSLTFHNLGLIKLTPTKTQGRENVRRVRAEMSFHGINFNYGNSA